MSGKMTIEDFYAQMESASRMGFRNIIENLGISGIVKEDKLDEMQVKMEKWRFIIQSMTNEERKDPEIINESRRRRISRGCGLPEGEIKEMVKQYNTSKTFMKHNKGRAMGGFLRKFGLG
jgi:signal recognition particle subunit SRP54